jgi:hypothetical protein
VDDALGEEVRVTVIAAGFDKLASVPTAFERRLSRILDEPTSKTEAAAEGATGSVASILDEEDELFTQVPETVVFESEDDDLDIPDFLKS